MALGQASTQSPRGPTGVPSEFDFSNFNLLSVAPPVSPSPTATNSLQADYEAMRTPPVVLLPPEILLGVFSHLDPLSASLDRFYAPLVCKAWRHPGQVNLFTDIYLVGYRAISKFYMAITARPDLSRACQRLRFFTDEDDWLADVDALAVFTIFECVTSLRYYELEVPYTEGDIHSVVCNTAKCPLETISITCAAGTYQCHLVDSLRFPQLSFLKLAYLTDLKFESLQTEWITPTSLRELVLIEPDITGDALEFILVNTTATLRKLSLTFNELPADENHLQEDDLVRAFLAGGQNLLDVEILFPFCTTLFLNDAVRGLRSVEHITIDGVSCDAKMDRNCPASLRRMTIYVAVGFNATVFSDLWHPGYRTSNITDYEIRTIWAPATPEAEAEANEGKLEWSQESIREWRDAAIELGKVGIDFYGDFFPPPP